MLDLKTLEENWIMAATRMSNKTGGEDDDDDDDGYGQREKWIIGVGQKGE